MTTDLAADIVVIGAGPAGAAAAALLAPSCRTLVLDRAEAGAPRPARIGEALPAASRRLLRDMGLWDAFLAEGHAPCQGADSLWGGPDPVSVDAMRDLDGPGWHLDRGRFEEWLRACAARRGAALVAPAKLAGLARTGDGWRLTVSRHGRPLTVAARIVIDAGGRASPVARALGRRRTRQDRLICRWLHGRGAEGPRRTMVAAEAEGWWYTAPLPAGRRVLAFHTDADLPAAVATADAPDLLARARRQPGLADILDAAGFVPDGPAGSCAAHSARIDEAAGEDWLAVGDAALACDPLSSQGLLNALYSALTGAEAALRTLAGEPDALGDYRRGLDAVAGAYDTHLRAWYGLETRWADRPFWSRRHGG